MADGEEDRLTGSEISLTHCTLLRRIRGRRYLEIRASEARATTQAMLSSEAEVARQGEKMRLYIQSTSKSDGKEQWNSVDMENLKRVY